MRKILLAVLLFPTLAFAQITTIDKPVVCDKTKSIVESLSSGDYKEQPFWIGKDDSSKYSLFVNTKTGSWTFIQFNSTLACVLATGEGHKLVFLGPKT